MTRAEFMAQLCAELADLPAEERQAALDYYTEYLDEAGPENEAQALQLLGTPAQVAAQIRAEMPADWAAGYTGSNGDAAYGTCLGEDPAAECQPDTQPKPIYQTGRTGGIDWRIWLLLGIATLPLWFGAVGALLGLLGVVLGIVAAALALAVSGVAMGVASAPLLATHFGSGLVNIGIALLLAALGLLVLAGCWWICVKGIPGIVRWGKNLIEAIKRKVSTL